MTAAARALADELVQECGSSLRVRIHAPGNELTTFAVGGRIELLIEPGSIEAAANVLRALETRSVNWRVLGAGSNILIGEQGVPSVVIKLGRGLSGWAPIEGSVEPKDLSDICSRSASPQKTPEPFSSDTKLIAFGAAPLMSLSRKLSALGLSGLEFAAGIPGSLGGAVVMNAGAHGRAMDEIVSKVYCLSPSGELSALDRSELHFSYRRSRIPAGHLVLAAELQLKARPSEEISSQRVSCLEYRRKTQPLHLPSAGSVFKNPLDTRSPHCDEQRAAAELLEEAGLKGLQRDGIGFSDMHANWLCKVQPQGAADDALWLMEHAQEKVMQAFGIALEPEIIRW